MGACNHNPVQSVPSAAIPAELGAASVVSSFGNSLIINADDWGRDVETTDRILNCVTIGAVSSTSAMVFMVDSERAADVATRRGIDCGLHLNFTMPFSSANCPSSLREHQTRVIQYLRRNRWARTLYHPGLASSFKYLAAAQICEFERMYGSKPQRLDGHHHMHLCANVLFGGLLPSGTIARRNFSFAPGEKSMINRLYRGSIDRVLARRHQLTDYFFSLSPVEPASRIDGIVTIARRAMVEVETHPVNPDEYRFLISGEILRRTRDVQIARGFPPPSGSGR